jgi:hypothetical protein
MPEKTNKPENEQNEDEQNEDGRNEGERNKHQQLRLDRQHQANARPEPISLHAIAEPSRKRRGEAAEAAFLARATSMGFRICKPWGECERYDLVIDYGKGGFYRVQSLP